MGLVERLFRQLVPRPSFNATDLFLNDLLIRQVPISSSDQVQSYEVIAQLGEIDPGSR